MELFVPSFEGERKRSTRPAMRVLTAGTARACIHDLLPPRPLSGRPVTPDTPFILLILDANEIGGDYCLLLTSLPDFPVNQVMYRDFSTRVTPTSYPTR